METQFISFIFGSISTLLISFLTHFLSIKRFRQATIYGEQVKCYSEIMPILFSPIDQEMSTAELKLIFNKAILVSNGSLSKELFIFLNCIINVRLGNGLIINNDKNLNLFQKFVKNWKYKRRINKMLIKDRKRKTFFQKLYANFYDWNLNRILFQKNKRSIFKPTRAEVIYSGQVNDPEIISKELKRNGSLIIKMIHRKMNL